MSYETKYYIEIRGEVVEVDEDLCRRWIQVADTIDGRRVGYLSDVGNSTVSTVFLGYEIDRDESGKPLVYETLVRGGEWDGEGDRYASLTDAIRGHARTVVRLRGIERERTIAARLNGER
jgi:hypothetical protein